MKKDSTLLGIILVVIILVLIYFYQTHISIWGFSVSKGELRNVIINTNDKVYWVGDSKFVQELSKEVSKMKRLNKIQPNNYPLKEKSTKYQKIKFQTENDYTYGGSFGEDSNGQIIDSNGYYWSVSKDLFDLMDNSLNGAKILSSF
jgi:hypothetical protein